MPNTTSLPTPTYHLPEEGVVSFDLAQDILTQYAAFMAYVKCAVEILPDHKISSTIEKFISIMEETRWILSKKAISEKNALGGGDVVVGKGVIDHD